MIVDETNKNAKTFLDENKNDLKPKSRFKLWKSTNATEIKQFLGILLWMGLVQFPKISDYWSNMTIYQNSIVKNFFTRDRFLLILRFMHFADESTADKSNKLYKLQPLIEALNKKFKEIKIPPEMLVVDESMIPFRGRLSFKQYLPGKANKYGIKVFKLCDNEGYTYNFDIYKGKDASSTNKLLKSEEIVLKLAEPYLNNGRTIVTDNYFTSLHLSQELNKNSTHLLSTMKKCRKGLSKDVIQTKLKKGESIFRYDEDGTCVMK